ncbi:hypothetical protein L6R53_00015 [Myxococcota bacterium]|nr:hypothetical protein [Myxococcota bacterium]
MMTHLLAILGLALGVAAWGLLMVRRQKDKAEIGVTELDGCHSCSSTTCEKRGASTC